MTFDEAIRNSGLPRLDAEVLLAFAAGCTRTSLMTKGHEEIPEQILRSFESFVVRRKKNEPVSYITGIKEFYGRPFQVTKDTLIPRPSTEGLIDLSLSFLQHPQKQILELDSEIAGLAIPFQKIQPTIILDIGTGSGCIAITLALEGVMQKIIGVDVSEPALHIAKENAEMHGVHDRVEWKETDGADVIRDMNEPFLVVSNPPYIPDGTVLQTDVAEFEPAGALFSGADGLGLISRIMASARGNPHCTGMILECRANQVEAIENML